MTLNRVAAALPEDLEQLVRSWIGCCLIVHRSLGPGYNEGTYARACRLELRAAGLSFEEEKTVTIRYRGALISTQRVDLFGRQSSGDGDQER